MKVAIHQPHYVPWEGYLAKWRAADLLIVLDTVQFEKGGYQNRTNVDGRWITLPVKVHLGMKIHDVYIDNAQPWKRKHEAALPQFKDLYAKPWHRLVPLALATMERLCDRPYVLASDLHAESTDPTGRLVELCRTVYADTYLSGPHGPRYLDFTQFAKAQIAVEIFQHA